MIKTVAINKGSSLKVGQGFPKIECCENYNTKVYLNPTEYFIVSKPMDAKEIEEELKTFGMSMSLVDRTKVSEHFGKDKIIKTTQQNSYEDNNDEAILAKEVLNHESVINTIPNKLEFRRLCYFIGAKKGFSRSVINKCIANYDGKTKEV